MKLEIREHGVMRREYFGGTSGVMITVNIDRDTTLAQLLDELCSEIDFYWDHIEHTAEYHDYDTNKLESDLDEQIAEIRENISDNPDLAYCESLEHSFNQIDDSEDFNELPVAIFTIEFING